MADTEIVSESRGTPAADGAASAGALARMRLDAERLRLEAEIGALRGGLQPWWRQGRSVTALVALFAAIVPITTGVQGLIQREKDQETAYVVKQREARDKYLDTVLKDKKNAQLILRYILATAEDPKILMWADGEQRILKEATTSASKEELYRETVAVVAKLARGSGDSSKTEKQFGDLYEQRLLPVESQEVVALMVRARKILDDCTRPLAGCPKRAELQNVAYQLASQTRREIINDAIADPQSNTPAAPPK